MGTLSVIVGITAFCVFAYAFYRVRKNRTGAGTGVGGKSNGNNTSNKA
jgi:hypothetical protein